MVVMIVSIVMGRCRRRGRRWRGGGGEGEVSFSFLVYAGWEDVVECCLLT